MAEHVSPEVAQREQMAMAQRSGNQAALLARLDTDEVRFTDSPQRFYTEQAARCPVVHEPDLATYQLFTMEDTLYVNRHPDTRQSSVYLGSTRPAIPLGLDGPEHRKYRKLLDPVFAPRNMDPLVPRIRQLAHDLIDGFIERGSADAYKEWAEILPATIFLNMLGLPTDDLSDFLRFKNLILGNDELQRLPADEQVGHRIEAAMWIHNYFNAALDTREASGDPGDDLIGWLLTTEVDEHRLTREDIQDILGLLMIAGLDTVAASLACFLSHFARNPADRAKVVADPTLWPSAIEELMRFESPVTEGGRIVTSEMTLPSGYTLPAGAAVSISWHAANLDPAVFPDPLTVDFQRSPNRHIGFASGIHRCLGSHLARLEMVAAMDVWHERIPDYRIAPGVELKYSGNPRAPHKLPLVW